MPRGQMLSVVAMCGMRKLGTPGVQLWGPGRAIVRSSLSDPRSPEGGGGVGLLMPEE